LLIAVAEPGSRLVARRGVLTIVKRSGERITVPPDTEMIILATGRAALSTKALRLALSRGITLAVLGWRGEVLGYLQPSVVNKTASTRLQQMARVLAGEARRVAKELIYSKVLGQANTLKYLAKALREPWLRDRGYEIDSVAARLYNMDWRDAYPEKLMEIEAYAARLYWEALASITPGETGFTGRCQECGDPVNSALNLSYAVLYSVVRRALLLAGLDPYIGVLHSLKSGKEALVYDFSEPFKPCIDRVLFARRRALRGLETGENGYLKPESKKTVLELALRALEREYPHRGRKRMLKRIIELEAWMLAAWFREGGEYSVWHAPVG